VGGRSWSIPDPSHPTHHRLSYILEAVMPPPLVEIIWEDFTASHGWKEMNEINTMIEARPEDYIIRTVGYLIDKNEDRLVLVGSILDKNFLEDKGDVVADLYRVPVAQIKELIVLERPNE
jgi:hypothetical protein